MLVSMYFRYTASPVAASYETLLLKSKTFHSCSHISQLSAKGSSIQVSSWLLAAQSLRLESTYVLCPISRTVGHSPFVVIMYWFSLCNYLSDYAFMSSSPVITVIIKCGSQEEKNESSISVLGK